MNRAIRRGAGLTMLALTSAGLFGAGTAAATDTGAASTSGHNQVQAQPLSQVKLTATQGTLNATQMQLENISATATDARTGEPIVGVLIKFATTSGGRDLGSAYTDGTGKAGVNCSENLGMGTVQELLGGYSATMQGDGVHTPVTAHAAII